MKTVNSIICGAAAILATSTALASIPSTVTSESYPYVPKTMNYQGYLANPNTGAKYADGIYDLQCRIYRQPSGGTAIWAAQYSVYVKDGYFNIMLGDSSAKSIYSTVSGTAAPTYGITELWKALWYDSSFQGSGEYGNNSTMWLGVTPLQSATHTPLSQLSEISPRQQLLTAPFAFRANAARFADKSPGNFRVNGDLTVTGTINYGGFDYITSRSNLLLLGRSTDTWASSAPAITNNASRYAVMSFYDAKIASNSGNIQFSAPSTKAFNFDTGSFAVTNFTRVSFRSGNTSLNMEDSIITGMGGLRWKKSASSPAYLPFTIFDLDVSIADDSSSGSNELAESVDSSDYTYCVVGFGAWSGDTDARVGKCWVRKIGGKYRVIVNTCGKVDGTTTIRVQLLGIHKSMVKDNRPMY